MTRRADQDPAAAPATAYDRAGFAAYLTSVAAKSAHTVKSYLADLDSFAQWFTGQQLELRAALTRPRAGLYLIARTGGGRGTAGATLGMRSAARAVSALKAYGGYLVHLGELRENPLAMLQPPKYARPLPDYINSSELRAVVCAFDTGTTPRELRNAALLHLVYAAGLRAGETAALDMGDADPAAQFVRVLGKGRRERVVPFGVPAARALERYLTEGRPGLARAEAPVPALWLGPSGRRLSVRSIGNILSAAVLRAGQLRQLSPHKLRHACATHLLEGGANVRLVQELLGHESLQTTQVYTQITAARLREVYDASHPRAKLH